MQKVSDHKKRKFFHKIRKKLTNGRGLFAKPFLILKKKDMKYYHLFSAPLDSCPLFRDDKDRKFFLNRIVIYLSGKNIMVYAYCLMDNHIHFLMSGEEQEIKDLFSDMKREYGKWLKKTDSVISVNLEDFSVSLRVIKGADDFKTVVAYILRNPMVAGMGSPISYMWNSSFLYFNPMIDLLRDYSLKEYGILKFRQEIARREQIPMDYRILDGIYNPRYWCQYKKVEQIFGRSVDYFKLLGKWGVENEEEAKMQQIERNAYSDSQILTKVNEYCTLIGVDKVEELSAIDIKMLVRTLQERWGASKKQIKRIIGSSVPFIE